jgi:membrane associated rhomboid family serine protease
MAMIPVHDDNPSRGVPWVTIAIIAANILVFLLWEPILGSKAEQQTFFFCQAEIPYEVTNQTNLADGGTQAREALTEDLGSEEAVDVQRAVRQECPGKNWWLAIFVAMFLHGGWSHIAGNMVYLGIFGNNVEDRLGRFPYLAFYVMGGLAAGGLQVAFGPSSTIPSLGASGAIAAVLGAYLVLFPGAGVYTIVIPFFPTVRVPALVLLGLWFVYQLFSGIGSIGADTTSGVAYWAHIGGFVFGVVIAWLFYRDRGGGRLAESSRDRHAF